MFPGVSDSCQLITLFWSKDVPINIWGQCKRLILLVSIQQQKFNHLAFSRQDLDSMFGRLTLNKEVEFSASTNILVLTGAQGIWQSSVVLDLPDGRRSCATLIVSN